MDIRGMHAVPLITPYKPQMLQLFQLCKEPHARTQQIQPTRRHNARRRRNVGGQGDHKNRRCCGSEGLRLAREGRIGTKGWHEKARTLK